METLTIPLEQLEPNPWNARRMHQRQLDTLRRSIRRDGFLVPIVARPLNEDGDHLTEEEWQEQWLRSEDSNAAHGLRWQILGGEQRYRALRAEEISTADVVPFPCNDRTARRITISLNNEGADDRQSLDALLTSLVTDFDYPTGELSDMTAIPEEDILAAVELGPSEGTPFGVGSDEPSEMEQTTIQFKLSEDGAAEFMAALATIGSYIGAEGAETREPELLAMANLALEAIDEGK